MRMKRLEEMIAVMQAAEGGKSILRIGKVSGSERVQLPEDVTWDWLSYDYDVLPEPKRVNLGPGDVKAGDMIREIGCKTGWAAVCGARGEDGPWDGIWVVGVKGVRVIPWTVALERHEISRDGGKTWGPCSKEEL